MYGRGAPSGMSATDTDTDGRADGSERLAEFPEFGLSYLLDDAESPAAVTLYDPAAPDSEWISADVSGAVPIEETR